MAAQGQAQIGLIGLGVMGRNLALNIEEKGYSLAIYNRTTEKTEQFVSEFADRNFTGTASLEEFVASLERPRKIILMIMAGDPVDAMLLRLRPLLDAGDIVIDTGNSWFEDTQRRAAELADDRLHFMGMGVSGGEEGARHGPSLMPGGPSDAYRQLKAMLGAIAAQTESGPCVTYIGPGGSGNFVKMVHNGIEYGVMQLIAEAFALLRCTLSASPLEIAGIFENWNSGPLDSYLIDLTAKVLSVRDCDTGRALVDEVLDVAGQKGTGAWTVQAALELGVPVPTISAAVDARMISAMKEERIIASEKIRVPVECKPVMTKEDMSEIAHSGLLGAIICAYAQGFSLIKHASKRYEWKINLKEVARIWKGGCIIRARLLDDVMNAFDHDPDLHSLLLDGYFSEQVFSSQIGWRRFLHLAHGVGVPVPAMGSSISYFDSYRKAVLPQNLTQAQRDAFGAHTYIRADSPEEGPVHTDWLKLAQEQSKALKR